MQCAANSVSDGKASLTVLSISYVQDSLLTLESR